MHGSSLLSLSDIALRGAVVSLLALLAAILWRERRALPAARLGAALGLGLCAYVVNAAPGFLAQAPVALQLPFVAFANGNPLLFWLFARALLEDDARPGRGAAAAWLLLVAMGGLSCLWPGPPDAPAPLVLGAVLALSPLFFSALVIRAALTSWRGDLVEDRRRLRGFIVGIGCAYLLTSALARLGTERGRFSQVSSLIDIIALTLIVAIVAWRLLRLGRSDLFPRAASAQPAPALPTAAVPASTQRIPGSATGSASAPAPDPAQDRLAEQLALLMQQERVYCEEALTIVRLAQRLDVPEYRLRRLINQRLGHRNFNAYINQYRLTQAMADLSDPAKSGLPILSIALEAGFQSIGPFNRAFKAQTGLTPSEFRQQHRTDSGNG